MNTIAGNRSKIRAAEQATDSVQDLVGQVLADLNRTFNGRIVNGFGVYVDRGRQGSVLADCKVKLDQAYNTLYRTPWPTDEDYGDG